MTNRVSHVLAFAGLAWMVILATSCRMPSYVVETRADGSGDSATVYVIQHGWHAGIAFAWNERARRVLPDFPGLPQTTYLEVGWGEAGYYPNPDPGIGATLRAGLWPTSSVVHAKAISSAIPDAFPQQRTVRLRISAQELERLLTFIAGTVATGDDGRASGEVPGHFRTSRFYRSTLRYHAFQNCNHWAAEALEAAGCSTARWRSLTVGRVLAEAEDCAR